MTKVLIVYATDYGNTKKMADAVADGAKAVQDTEVLVKTAENATKEDLLSSDAMIMGTPVHMGSPDWRLKQFIDKVCSGLWMKDALVGKVAGVFASGGGFGNAGGGCELSLLALLNNIAELGMIIIPLPKNTPNYKDGGIQWGPYGRSGGPNMETVGVSKEALEVAKHHGSNVARAANILKGQHIFVQEQAEKASH